MVQTVTDRVGLENLNPNQPETERVEVSNIWFRLRKKERDVKKV